MLSVSFLTRLSARGNVSCSFKFREMNIVYAFFVPLVRWASFGFTEGLSPIKTARRILRNSFPDPFRKNRIAGDASRSTDNLHPLQLKWRERDSFFDADVQKVLMQRHPSQTVFTKNNFKGFPIDAWKAVDQFARTAGSSERSLAEFGVFMRLDPVWISKLLSAVTQAHESRPRQRYSSSQTVDLENRRRKEIVGLWAECWIAHYRLNDSLTESTSEPRARCAAGC